MKDYSYAVDDMFSDDMRPERNLCVGEQSLVPKCKRLLGLLRKHKKKGRPQNE